MEGANKKRKFVTQSDRAGLVFPVGRIHRKLKEQLTSHVRISGTAGVYMGAVLEYLVSEIFELAGGVAKDLGVKRLTPRHLELSIRADAELDTLCKATIAGGGVVPFIHKVLINKNYVAIMKATL